MEFRKPGIGRPPRYHNLVHLLEDEQLYTPGGIAQVLSKEGGLVKRQIQIAFAKRVREHDLAQSPDGWLDSARGKVPAWKGRTWKETFDDYYLALGAMAAELGDEGESGRQPEAFSQKREKRIAPSSMKYDHFIVCLHPFKRYGPADIVAHGVSRGMFSRSSDKRFKAESRLLLEAARKFSDRIDAPPDRIEMGKRGYEHRLWYGWRWQLALSEQVFDSDARQRLMRKVRFRQKLPSWRIGLASCMMVLLIGLVIAVSPNRLARGYDILNQHGARAAAEYFVSGAYQTPRDRFGLAWSAFRQGDYDLARDLANDVLEEVDPQEKIAGDCYYLLGYVALYARDYSAALWNLLTSEKIFKKIGHEQGLHLVYCGLCRLAMDQEVESGDEGLLDRASSYLDQAGFLEPLTADYYYLSSRLAFKDGDYSRALEFARLRLDLMQDNPNGTAQALSGVGFYLILTGSFNEGLEATFQSEVLTVKTQDQRQYYYNLINRLIYNKCNGLPYTYLERAVENYANEQNNRLMFESLQFAKSFSCQTLRVDAGDPSPPPPDMPPAEKPRTP